jgi:hypothetical protein
MSKWSVAIVIVFLAVFLGSALWMGEKQERQSLTPFDADGYIARSLAKAKETAPDGELASLFAGYVDPDGKIHPEIKGSLRLIFRSPSHPPSAEKPILGAPPAGGPKCPRLNLRTYVYSGSKTRRLVEVEPSWQDDATCGPTLPQPLRCSVAAIWRRAIADGAPRPAYADLQLETRDTRRVWQLKITDRSDVFEKVVFRREYPDDCR